MHSNFNKLKNSWTKFGASEPYWSVLTQDRYKLQSGTQNFDSFFPVANIRDCIYVIRKK
jgi:hypothetical protein